MQWLFKSKMFTLFDEILAKTDKCSNRGNPLWFKLEEQSGSWLLGLFLGGKTCQLVVVNGLLDRRVCFV